MPLDVADIGTFTPFRLAVQEVMASNVAGERSCRPCEQRRLGIFNPIATVTEDQFDGLLNLHLKGPFFLTQSLLPLFMEGTSIVNLTSATTRVATAGVAPDATFKGDLEVLTRYMAKEFGERRIGVNAVTPGAIRTDLGGGLNAELETLLASQTALGRVGEPEEVARVIAMLLTADGAWVNAQNIEVAGGYTV